MTGQAARPTTTGLDDRQDGRDRQDGTGGWWVVAEQECRDLWIGGRGWWLLFAFSLLLSAITYLSATNQVLNFLEQREAVNLTVQIMVAVGLLVTLIVSADAISGERERGTLEGLLVTPVSRRGIVLGKLTAALSLWLAAFVVGVPYVWVLGHGVSVVGGVPVLGGKSIVVLALLSGFLVGTLLAVGLAALGVLISALTNSNRLSLSVSLFLLLALFAPTQLPGGLPHSWVGEVLLRLNPVASGLRYLTAVLVTGHDWTRDLSYLISPVLTVVLAGGLLILASPRIVQLSGGGGRGGGAG